MLVTGALRKGATEHCLSKPTSAEQSSSVVAKEKSVSGEATTGEEAGLASSSCTKAVEDGHGQIQQQKLDEESDNYVL